MKIFIIVDNINQLGLNMFVLGEDINIYTSGEDLNKGSKAV